MLRHLAAEDTFEHVRVVCCCLLYKLLAKRRDECSVKTISNSNRYLRIMRMTRIDGFRHKPEIMAGLGTHH